MNGNYDYFVRLDEAGQLPSKVNEQLVKALDRLHPSHPARIFVERAAALNSELGDEKLKALEDWGKADAALDSAPLSPHRDTPPAPRPPVQTVDVGSLAADQGAFVGLLNPVLMSGPNWGYYAKKNLGAQSGHIFDRPFVIGDPNTGSIFDAGTLAILEGMADPIVRDAQGNQVADLSQWG